MNNSSVLRLMLMVALALLVGCQSQTQPAGTSSELSTKESSVSSPELTLPQPLPTAVALETPYPLTTAEAVGISTAPGEAQWTPIISLPAGAGKGQVADELHVGGGSSRGPQALAFTPDGTIYLLDSVQRRVHAIAGGKVTKTVLLPFTFYPSDIVVTANGMYILDFGARGVLHVSYTGELINKYTLPPGLDGIRRLYADPTGRVRFWAAYYREFDL